MAGGVAGLVALLAAALCAAQYPTPQPSQQPAVLMPSVSLAPTVANATFQGCGPGRVPAGSCEAEAASYGFPASHAVRASDGACFYFSEDFENWKLAEPYCRSLGLRLACIRGKARFPRPPLPPDPL